MMKERNIESNMIFDGMRCSSGQSMHKTRQIADVKRGVMNMVVRKYSSVIASPGYIIDARDAVAKY